MKPQWSARGACTRIARAALVLVAGSAVAGCSPSPHADESQEQTLAAAPASAEIFAPGIISDERWQWRLTFTPDGATAYYATSDGFFPLTRSATILVSQRSADGSWSQPQVAPFSGTHSDMDPFITPDGTRLYFSSNRPVAGEAKEDFDIWYVERTPAGWGEPVHAGSNVNSELDELYPSATASGTLYFASGPFGFTPDADWDIYRAEPDGRGFSPRERLDVINTRLPFDPANPQADWEFNPEISADGRVLVFTSLRPGGYGWGDLYVSFLHEGRWSEPRNLGPTVNTAEDEFHPTLSRDGRTLYFARTILSTGPVPSDFYRIDTRALGVPLRLADGEGHGAR